MAMINDWDLKESNSAIYEQKREDGSLVQVYMISDLGASLGTTGLNRTHRNLVGESQVLQPLEIHTTVDFEVPKNYMI